MGRASRLAISLSKSASEREDRNLSDCRWISAIPSTRVLDEPCLSNNFSMVVDPLNLPWKAAAVSKDKHHCASWVTWTRCHEHPWTITPRLHGNVLVFLCASLQSQFEACSQATRSNFKASFPVAGCLEFSKKAGYAENRRLNAKNRRLNAENRRFKFQNSQHLANLENGPSWISMTIFRHWVHISCGK